MTLRRDMVPREMPVSLRCNVKRMNTRHAPVLKVVPVRIGDATGQAIALAKVVPSDWRGAAGWRMVTETEAAMVARQCRAAAKPDRRNPWPSGYRTALGRLADQIDKRLEEVRK